MMQSTGDPIWRPPVYHTRIDEISRSFCSQLWKGFAPPEAGAGGYEDLTITKLSSVFWRDQLIGRRTWIYMHSEQLSSPVQPCCAYRSGEIIPSKGV